MDNKNIRLTFRILLFIGIILNANGQGEGVVQIHEDCRLHELCPLNCVRCDTVPQCYDMSDEFGCGHGIEVFHKLFPGPPVPPGMVLDKLKEILWLEKLAYINEQLQKSSNNTVKSSEILFRASDLPHSDKPGQKSQSIQDNISTTYKSSGASSPTLGVKQTFLPQRNTQTSQRDRTILKTTTPAYKRFNSRIVHSSHSEQNVPSIYSSKAAVSPLLNWPGTPVGTAATSPEKERLNKEATPRTVGVSVPILPDPIPDPEPPSKKQVTEKPNVVTELATPPEIMPPIKVPSTTADVNNPIYYQEPSTTPKTTMGVEENELLTKGSTKQRTIIFRPEPLPTASATVSLPKVTAKQDSVIARVNSLPDMYSDTKSNGVFMTDLQESPAPAVSLSRVPGSTGIILSPSQVIANSQSDNTMTQSSDLLSNQKNVNQDQTITVDDHLLPSIPMLPGLIPKLPASKRVSTNKQTLVTDYKVGDLYLALPPVENKVRTGTSAESNKPSVFSVDSNNNQRGATSQSAEGIPVRIADTMLVDQTLEIPSANQARDTTSNTWQSDKASATNRQTVDSTDMAYSKHNKQSTPNSLPNVEFAQTSSDRRAKESTQSGIDQQNLDYTQTAASMNAFDQTATIDLLSLLFPGMKAPSLPEFATESSHRAPDVMPEIVPATQTTPSATSVTIAVSKGDNGNGCDRIQDYTGFCSSRTHGYYKNNYDCASYIVCDWGRMHLCRCPLFTVFDSNLGVCNWETEVEC